MNILAVIFQVEFLRRLRSRAFIAGTIVGILGIGAITVLPPLISGAFAKGNAKIVLIGPPQLTSPARTLVERDFEVTAVLPALDGRPTQAFLDAHGRAASVAVLSSDAAGLHVTAYARDAGAFRSGFARDLVPLNLSLRTHVSTAAARGALDVPVEVKSLDAKFADQGQADAARGVAYLFVLLLYLSILLNAQSIMASVAEEKTSRIAEVLVATVRPSILLAGKMLASAATGLVQLLVWIASGVVAAQFVASRLVDPKIVAGATAAASAHDSPFAGFSVSAGEVIAFVAFFLVGFTQYALLYAAAASLINRTEDLGSVAGPLVIPVVGAFLLAQYALGFPNATNVAIFSQIPLIAPFVMFTRITIASVPAWQIVLALAINVAAAVAIALVAGKVYRVGMLLYGRPPSFKQIVAVLRT